MTCQNQCGRVLVALMPLGKVKPTMTLEQAVLEKLRQLPLDKQQEVLQFAESLQTKTVKPPLRSVKGLWSHLDNEITENDLTQARQEMWSNFPRNHLS